MNIFREYYGNSRLTARQILTDPVLFLAFGFGSGLVKKAPGTMGTLAAIPVYLLAVQFNVWIFALFTLLATIAGVWICDGAAKKLNEHDYGGIVWDEVAGYLITMLFVPFSWPALISGFLLFRLFDIFKPQPIKWVDSHVAGGLGIMLDDVIAALFAGLLLYAMQSWL
jgi:phosphatidylglycerophosphatase A